MSNSTAHREQQLEFLKAVLRPVAKFCLKRTIKVQEATQLLKVLMLELAEEELKETGGKVNASRLGLLTGIYREDIAKILQDQEAASQEPPRANLHARVIGQWEQDRAFRTAHGKPRVLTFEGEDSEFFRLVKRVKQGTYPPTVLAELERSGAVERTKRGLRLIRGGIVWEKGSDAALDLLSRGLGAMMPSAEQNLGKADSIGGAYIRTEYDNISKKHLPEIRRWLVAQTRVFHKKARDYLSRYDVDLNSKLALKDSAGERVIVHSFSLSSPLRDE